MTHHRHLTPEGLAGVAVIAVIGNPGDLPLYDARRRRQPWPGPGRVRFALLLDEDGRLLDEALVVGQPAGAELHVHGGPGVRSAVCAWLARSGVVASRPAGPVEAPNSRRHARALLSSRTGPLAALAERSRTVLDGGRVDAGLARLLRRSLRLGGFAERLVVPPTVRLVGAPNAGKSSLFNALLGRERAVVSPQEGTTRDVVAATLMLRGVPIRLEDTAGGSFGDGGGGLAVHVLRDPQEAGTGPSEALEVLGRGDLQGPAPRGLLAVSALTGQGLGSLLDGIAHRLEIPAAERWDHLVPVDRAQRALFAKVLAAGDSAAVTRLRRLD